MKYLLSCELFYAIRPPAASKLVAIALRGAETNHIAFGFLDHFN